MSTRNRVIGVRFNPDDPAPTIVLKAAGEQADPVLAAARDIPIVRDAALAEQLYRVPIDAPIGCELFPVMAVLLAQVLDLDQLTSSEESR
jgi:type III secretion system FlhB-like substrate exporter